MNDRFTIISTDQVVTLGHTYLSHTTGDHLLDTQTKEVVVSDCNIDAPEDATLGRNFKPLVDLLGPGFRIVVSEDDEWVDLVDPKGALVVFDCNRDAPEDATLGRNFKGLVDRLNIESGSVSA